jgi:hypothetical protein
MYLPGFQVAFPGVNVTFFVTGFLQNKLDRLCLESFFSIVSFLNILQDQKVFKGTNTLAYLAAGSVRIGTRANVIKFFTVILYTIVLFPFSFSSLL